MKLSEELESIQKHICTSINLPVSNNDLDSRKQQLSNVNTKIIDPIVNQQIFDILQEQLKQFKLSFEHILNTPKKEPLANNEHPNELPNETKELQDQVNLSSISRSHRYQLLFLDHQITFVVDD